MNEFFNLAIFYIFKIFKFLNWQHDYFAYPVIKTIRIYDSLYVFEGEKSIFDIITELQCLDDFENPDQLPVQEVLEGTDDYVL